MNLECAIVLYAGGPGSGCHGDLCGRPPLEGPKLATPEQESVAKGLMKAHDEIKDDPRREDTRFQSKQESLLKWQGEKLESLVTRVSRASGHPAVQKKVKEAREALERADSYKAKDLLNHAIESQEWALMSIHEAIREMQRYPSSVRNVA